MTDLIAPPPYYPVVFSRFRAKPALRPFIQCFWQLDIPMAGSHNSTELLHPEGGSGLIFNFGDPLWVNGQQLLGSCILMGPSVQTQQLQLQGRVDTLGVRFMPGMAAGFFGLPMSQLLACRGQVADFQLHVAGEQLAAQLEPLNVFERITFLQEWLQPLLLKASIPRPSFLAALHWIEGQQGQQPVSLLGETLALSSRQLERQFRQWLGLSPKQFSRIQRVHKARELLKRLAGSHSLTALAHTAGYFDQAHFNHEFKQVTGMTPGRYQQRRSSCSIAYQQQYLR